MRRAHHRDLDPRLHASYAWDHTLIMIDDETADATSTLTIVGGKIV